MKYKYTPSLKEFGSSLKYRSREYFLENSLHGVPYFVDPTRPKWERSLWFFLTMTSIIAIAAIIVIIWHKFQTDPTITGLDIMTEHVNIEFPQVFVCFDWSGLNHSSYISMDDLFVYEHLYNWTWGNDNDLTTLTAVYANKNNGRKVFRMMIPECDYIISDCVYRGSNVSCEKLFTKALSSAGACCKSRNLEPLRIMDLSWNLEFKIQNSNFPLRIYFMQHNDLGPKPGQRYVIKAYFPIDIEFIVDITYTTPDIRYLAQRQRKCYYKQEGVDFNDCEVNCIANKLLKRCGCLPWFLSSVGKAECPISRYACLNNVAIDVIGCDCWLPCDHTSYSVKGSTKSPKDTIRIMLRNWPTALYKREMRFGYLDLLVSFGGIASLFLGYSLLTSVELGYYFSLRTYCGAVLRASREQYNIRTVYVVEKPVRKKVDLNPPCYYEYVN